MSMVSPSSQDDVYQSSDPLLLWIDEDSDRLPLVTRVGEQLGIDMVTAFSVREGIQKARRRIQGSGLDSIFVLLDMICPLGHPSFATSVADGNRTLATPIGGYQAWNGSLFLREIPELAERCAVISVIEPQRIREGLELLGLCVPRLVLHKRDLSVGAPRLKDHIADRFEWRVR